MKRYQKGVGTVVEWVKVRPRNEAFDLSVYCLAALYILGPRFVATIHERQPITTPPPAEQQEQKPVEQKPTWTPPRPRTSNWVTGWKKRW